MTTLLSLRLRQILFEYKFSRPKFVISIFRYCVFVSCGAGLIILRSTLNGSGSSIGEQVLSVIPGTNPISASVILALLFSHFSIKLSPTLPVQPFWRFYRAWVFYYLGAAHALLSSSQIFLATVFLTSFAMSGIAYYVVFFVTHFYASRVPSSRIGYIIVVLVIGFLELDVFRSIACFIVYAGSILWYDQRRYRRHLSTRRPGISLSPRENIFLKKEIEFIKYFGAERFYLTLGSLFAAILIASIYSFDGSEHLGFLSWLYLLIPFLPISLIIFNSLGMDLPVIRKYLYYSDMTTFYLERKYVIYRRIAHCINIIVAFSFYIFMRDVSFLLRYIIVSLLFIESIFIAAAVHSILFFEPKPIRYRYGRYIQSKNVNFQQICLVVVLLMLALCYYALGLWGIITCYALLVMFKYRYLEGSLKRCCAYRRKQG